MRGPQQAMVIFCLDCQALICWKCHVTGDHKRHQVDDAERVVQELKVVYSLFSVRGRRSRGLEVSTCVRPQNRVKRSVFLTLSRLL
jgi:hypothetical protein